MSTQSTSASSTRRHGLGQLALLCLLILAAGVFAAYLLQPLPDRAGTDGPGPGVNTNSVSASSGYDVLSDEWLKQHAVTKAPARSPAGPDVSQRQEALKDQWLERGNQVVLPQAFSRERQDDLKEQWLARGGNGAAASVVASAAVQRQEELKDRWLDRSRK